MPGVAGRSGGANRKSAEHHRLFGTFKPSRAAGYSAEAAEAAELSPAARKRALSDLGPIAQRVLRDLFDAYEDWTPASVEIARNFARSVERLEQMQAEGGDPVALHRELASNVKLANALRLPT